MKKYIAFLLCIVMCCLLLVACADPKIGEDLEDYKTKYDTKERELVTLNLYIIGGEGTIDDPSTPNIREDAAGNTVSDNLSAYFTTKFKTAINIKYIAESEYANTVLNAVNANDSTRADIVLVTGYDMFNTLKNIDVDPNKDDNISTPVLVTLNSMLNQTAFAKLNSPSYIPTSLQQAAKVELKNDNGSTSYMSYVVPNNRVLGSYEFIAVNKKMAENANLGGDKAAAMLDMNSQLVKDFVAILNNNGEDVGTAIKHVTGATYSELKEYENNGYICNLISVPTVTKEEAHASSFAIVRAAGDNGINSAEFAERYTRCMEVIYSINTDAFARNMLQYGIEDTHYVVDENGVISPKVTTNVYKMNLLYTGNIFTAFYTNGYAVYNGGDWTKEIAQSGETQNKDSVSATQSASN